MARTIFGEQTGTKEEGQEAIAWLIANRVLSQRKSLFANGKTGKLDKNGKDVLEEFPSSLMRIVSAERQFTALQGEMRNSESFKSKNPSDVASWPGWLNAVTLAHKLVTFFNENYTIGDTVNGVERKRLRSMLTKMIGGVPGGVNFYWYNSTDYFLGRAVDENGKPYDLDKGKEGDEVYYPINKGLTQIKVCLKDFKGNTFFNIIDDYDAAWDQ